MGCIDDHWDQEAVAWAEEEAQALDAEHGVWTTKNGRRIHIDKMATPHIKLARDMLQRKGLTDGIWGSYISKFDAVLAERGE